MSVKYKERYLCRLLSKIKERIRYNRCYDRMEASGVAVFSMCEGRFFGFDTVHPECLHCPYFTDIRG